ncbi:MAG: MOSC domain-containing protein [Burkholderiaceae bacterium]|nr:MOSC domain-containing protein [Burkholderiaceae bacterium]
MSGTVLSVSISLAREIAVDGRSVMSGIGKRGALGGVGVRPLGLEGDEQADPSVHGGLSKAVYAYPVEHYPFWQTVRAQARVAAWDAPLRHGFLGENLTLSGLLESQAWVGDVLRFADCDLAISEPRFPCFKLDAVMGFNQAARLMVESGWCGFYLAVRRPGTLRAGERFTLVPGPREVGIAELFRSRTNPARHAIRAG